MKDVEFDDMTALKPIKCFLFLRIPGKMDSTLRFYVPSI